MFSIILKLYHNYCNIGRLIDVQNASSKSLERVESLRVLMKWKIRYVNTPCVHHGWSHFIGSEVAETCRSAFVIQILVEINVCVYINCKERVQF